MQAPVAAAPDTIRAVIDSVFADPQYVWDQPRDRWAWLRELFAAVQRGLATLHEEHIVLYWLLVVALVLVLGAIVAHAAIVVYRAVRDRPVVRARTAPTAVAQHNVDWYLREARRLEDDGRLLESLAARFSALVHALEERKALRVHPSKTPMEYAREASLDAERRGLFAALVREYYRYLFGRAPIDRAALAGFDERAASLMDRGATV